MGGCMGKPITTGDGSSQYVKLAGGNVHLVVTKESWDEKLAEAKAHDKFVIANFSATWCGPCRIMAPFFCELSEKYPSCMFLTVDVDELNELGTSFDIKATPTFFFFKDGKQVDKLVGSNKTELHNRIIALQDSGSLPRQ